LATTRATSIETGLLRMQGEILLSFRSARQKMLATPGEHTASPSGALVGRLDEADGRCPTAIPSRDIALSYLRLANLDHELIDKLSRYEAGLWRQAVQTLFALQTLKRR
jgi:hypothetical protein